MLLEGKKCLVTGAGRGAGWGIALVLADEGADVAVCDLNPESVEETAKQITQRGVQSIHMPVDVSDENQVREMMARVGETFGGLDVLVNTVAWIDPPGPVADMPYDRWQFAVKTNLDSVFLCSKYALALMKPRRKGLIINISSVNGTRGFPNRASYSATKAAVINLTETLAMENRAFGVRANCLVPGDIEGERGRILRELAHEAGIEVGSEMQTFDPPLTALHPTQLGMYVAFLASDGGSAINGQSLCIGETPRKGAQLLF
jgi:NAD(P)-dependent dehydrogenase (short-subunit alcohol dehydrogenase family)